MSSPHLFPGKPDTQDITSHERRRAHPQPWPAITRLDLPHLPPFPVACLPPPLRDFAEALAETHQVPVDLPAVLMLPTVAALIAKKVEIKAGPGWCEPCNLYAVVALPPAHRKSAVFRDVTQPLEDIERRTAEQLAETIADKEHQHKIVAQALRVAEKKAARALPEDRPAALQEVSALRKELPEVPKAERLLVDDVSPEKLAKLLAENGGRIALMSAEGGVFDLIAGRYSNGSPNLDVYLKGHAGDTLRVDRIGRESDIVDSPALTMGLAVQPSVLADLAGKPGFRSRGLIARFLFSLPESTLGRRKIETFEVPPAVRARYRQVFTTLHQMGLLATPTPESRPRIITLSLEAAGIFRDFRAQIERDLGFGGALEMASDWGGKYAGAVARIAAALHCVEFPVEPYSVPVPAATIESAIAIGEYFKQHSLAAFGSMDMDPLQAKAGHVAAWLSREACGNFTARDVYQALRGRFSQMRELWPILALLEEHGYIRRVAAPDVTGPGRKPSPSYEANPALWAHDPQITQNG